MYNSFAEAAQASIDLRWGPICKAKTVRDMVEISWAVKCPLCKYLAVKHPKEQCGWPDKRQTICPMSDDPEGVSRMCCLDFDEWDTVTASKDGFTVALAAAKRIKARLKVIAAG